MAARTNAIAVGVVLAACAPGSSDDTAGDAGDAAEDTDGDDAADEGATSGSAPGGTMGEDADSDADEDSGDDSGDGPELPPPPAACDDTIGGHFVSPSGSATGDGSFEAPWDLQTALDHPPAVVPGDTIWLRGGTYVGGSFPSQLTGSARAPIVVRSCPGEWAILDGAEPTPQNTPVLGVLGDFAWYTDFEITNTEPTRLFPSSFDTCFEHQHCRPGGVDVFGVGAKIINLIVHDTGVGIGMWSSAVDAEAYGNIIYYSGWENEIRGSGHGVYTQNDEGLRRIADNIIFSAFHSGVHAYGSGDATVRNVLLEGNVIFGNGLLASDPNGWGILAGGNATTENIEVVENLLFNPSSFTRSNNLDPSYGLGTDGLVVADNYSVGYRAIGFAAPPTDAAATGNVFFGELGPATAPFIDAATNTVGAQQPSAIHVVLRPNEYDPARATVTVFNGTGGSEASVDLSSFLADGDAFEILDVQNYHGGPVVQGVYAGEEIPLPLDGVEVEPVVGTVPQPPVHTDESFGIFIVRRAT